MTCIAKVFIMNLVGGEAVFYSDEDTTVELLGVFKLKRGVFRHKSFSGRHYDSLCIRLEGTGTFRQGGRSFQVQPGDLLYCPQRCEYTQQTDGETILVVHFIRYARRGYTEMEKITPDNYAQIEQLMRNMYDVWSRKTPGYKYACTAQLYQLLYLIQQYRHEDALQAVIPTERLSVAVEYIHKHYKQDKVSVAELAKISAVSETYFRQLFKQVYGVSPCRYVATSDWSLHFSCCRVGCIPLPRQVKKQGFATSNILSACSNNAIT